MLLKVELFELMEEGIGIQFRDIDIIYGTDYAEVNSEDLVRLLESAKTSYEDQFEEVDFYDEEIDFLIDEEPNAFEDSLEEIEYFEYREEYSITDLINNVIDIIVEKIGYSYDEDVDLTEELVEVFS